VVDGIEITLPGKNDFVIKIDDPLPEEKPEEPSLQKLAKVKKSVINVETHGKEKLTDNQEDNRQSHF